MITITDRLSLSADYPNVDGRYTDNNGDPYASVAAATAALGNKINQYTVGLTVLVKESGWPKAKEYWVQPLGTTPTETYGLVEKPITVDSQLSDTSENPVQNKVITEALGRKGTYSKPGDGIPSTDMASAVQTSLGKADTSVQNITRNGSTLTKTDGVVDIPAEISSAQATNVAAGGDATATLNNGVLTIGVPVGHDAYNPFKGLYLDTDTLPTGQDGDYIYVVDTSATPRTATVYAWDGTTYSDTSTEVEIYENTFETGEQVYSVGIDNEPKPNSENILRGGGVYAQLTRHDSFINGVNYVVQIPTYTPQIGAVKCNTGEIQNEAVTAKYVVVIIPQGFKKIRLRTYAAKSTQSEQSYGYAFYNASTPSTSAYMSGRPWNYNLALTNTASTLIEEVEIPDGAVSFAVICKTSDDVLNEDNFFIEFVKGESLSKTYDITYQGKDYVGYCVNPQGELIRYSTDSTIVSLYKIDTTKNYLVDFYNTSATYIGIGCFSSDSIDSEHYLGSLSYQTVWKSKNIFGNIIKSENFPAGTKYITIHGASNQAVGHPKIAVYDILPPTPKKLSNSRRTFWQQDVNTTNFLVSDFTAESVNTHESIALYKDNCVLYLPSTYSEFGTPTKIIIYCKYGASTIEEGADTILTSYMGKVTRYWLSLGYGILAADGVPNGWATALGLCERAVGNYVAVRSTIRAWEYIKEHYNIDRDMAFIFGYSQGGHYAQNVIDNSNIPIAAAAELSPVCSMRYHQWDLAANVTVGGTTFSKGARLNIARIFNFPTVTNDTELLALEYDPSKTIGYDPWNRNVENEFTGFVQNGNLWELPTGTTIDNITMVKHTKCPLKIWAAENDETLGVDVMKVFIKAIKNCGQAADIQLFTSGGHNIPDTQSSIGSFNENNEVVSLYPIAYDIALWFYNFGGLTPSYIPS